MTNNKTLNEIKNMIGKQSEDYVRECLRHRISLMLMDTDEEHPMKVETHIGEDDACGLSTLLLLYVEKAFQIPSEGIIYFIIQGISEPIEFDDEMFSLNDLLNIADAIEMEL